MSRHQLTQINAPNPPPQAGEGKHEANRFCDEFYRIGVAQELLRRGSSLKLVAGEVGCGSTAAVSRAFSAVCGKSPREWRAAFAAAQG